jgi:hypothetical protein
MRTYQKTLQHTAFSLAVRKGTLPTWTESEDEERAISEAERKIALDLTKEVRIGKDGRPYVMYRFTFHPCQKRVKLCCIFQKRPKFVPVFLI